MRPTADVLINWGISDLESHLILSREALKLAPNSVGFWHVVREAIT